MLLACAQPGRHESQREERWMSFNVAPFPARTASARGDSLSVDSIDDAHPQGAQRSVIDKG